MTDRTDCPHCHTRVILAKGVPPLNYGPDPAGTVAARHLPSLAWRARWLARGEEPIVPEKRYAVHECEGTREAARHAAQRQQWQQAASQLARAQRNRRTRRREPEISGVRIPPPPLPGMEP